MDFITVYIIYLIIALVASVGLFALFGYMWNYYIIKELKNTNLLLEELIDQIKYKK